MPFQIINQLGARRSTFLTFALPVSLAHPSCLLSARCSPASFYPLSSSMYIKLCLQTISFYPHILAFILQMCGVVYGGVADTANNLPLLSSPTLAGVQ